MHKIKYLPLLSFFFCLVTSAQSDWELLNPRPSFLTGLDVHFLTDTKGFYITSNELFYTLDAGESWNLKTEFSGAADIAFHNTIGIVVGFSGSLLLSSDAGSTWSVKNVGVAETLNTVTLLDTENIVVSGTNSIFISTDGGDSWIQKNIPSNRINKTFFVNASIGHAVSDNGEIFKTIDGGDNWYLTADYTNIAPNSFFTVYFKNENVGFATREHNELYKTIDAGETWQEINTGFTFAIFELQFIDDNIGFGAGEFGVFKTINGGDTWDRIGVENRLLDFSDMNGIYFLDENRGFSVGQRGRIAKTEDSGDNWELFSPFDITVKQMEFAEPDIAIALVGNDYYRSVDNGASWDFQGAPEHFEFANSFDFIDGNVGYSIGGGTTSAAGSVYKTVNGGIDWSITNNGNVVLSAGLSSIEFVDENLGFVSGGFNTRRTFKTIDGGNNWRVVLSESLGQMQFLNSQVGYGRRIGNAFNKVFKTTDGGENWEEVFEIEEDINGFHFLDEETGYLVGDQSLIFKTEDGGLSWQELDLPFGFYEEVEFFSKNVGYVIEDSGHIYKTEDGGLSWDLIYTLFGLTDLEFNDQDEIFIAGTFGKILKSQVTFENFVLSVDDAFNLGATSASIKSNFAANAGSITNLKLEYGENGAFDQSVSFDGNVGAEDNKSFSEVLLGLTPNTQYSYRAVATFNGVEFNSNIKTFRTLENFSFIMNQVFNPSAESAEVSVRVLSNNAPVTNIQFEYGTEADALTETLAASPAIVSMSDGLVIAQGILTELQSETEYFIRGKAIYNGEEIYTNTLDFTTRPDLRVLNFYPSISGTDVYFDAFVTPYKADLTNIVFEYGPQSFDFSLDAIPDTIEQNRSQSIRTATVVLEENEIYYYRVKAILDGTEVYGPEAIFSLSDSSFLLAGEATEIQAESVVLNGRVFSNTGFLTNIQFEYGINGVFDQTTLAQPSFSSRFSTTQVQTLLTGLLPQTEYNYRMKATDSNGTDFYSEVGSFQTFFSSEPFVTTWQTDIPDESDANQITIPTFVGETYDYTVYWGDGSFDTNVTGDITHNYAVPGTYQVAISGAFPRIYFSGIGDNSKLIAIDQWGSIQWSSFEDAFNGCHNLDIKAMDVPDLSRVTNLNRAFGGCRSLIANETVNNWDVSGINTMIGVFSGARNFNQFIGDWDVSHVENLSAAFFLASSYNQDLSTWNVSMVKDMGQLFQEADAFNQDISSWDLSQVERMGLMFKGAVSFNQDISSWNTENVESIIEMFQDAIAFDQDLSAWNIVKIGSARNAFDNSGLSDENYEKMLLGWSQLPSLQNGVEFGALQNQYCEAEVARQFLIDNYGWTIVDAGRTASCPVDLDLDGVPDEFDLCPNTPTGTVVNDQGCDLIPSNAIQVYVSTPSCSGKSDGTIEVFMNSPGYLLDIVITGSEMSNQFNDVVSGANFVIDNLSSGIYELTISVPEILFEQRYTLTVNELQSIAGERQAIDVSSKSVSYTVSGSKNYVVSVNGESKVFQFENTEVQTIFLQDLRGQNEIVISGENDCQGKVIDAFFIGASISVYPTETSDYIYVVGDAIDRIGIFGLDGKMVLDIRDNKMVNQKEVDCSTLPTNLYLVKIISGENEKTVKIVKR